jgi:serine/threonine protein kinase
MTEPNPEVPKRLADFEIIRRLGAGGMAEVFLARKRGAERTYKLLVVKRILPQHLSSRRFRTMFAEEAQLATRLNHPNIVQVYDFQDAGEEGQLLSMEYVEGPDLRKLVRAGRAKNQRILPYVAAYIAAEVAKGLHYAHERKDERGNPLQIVHRDVSPQNILLSFDGAVKIADFGIATANLFREEHGILKGKTGYMSPEQARGEKVDRRTDIYSLGVVLHEMLSGRPLHAPSEGPESIEASRGSHVEPPSTFATGVPPEIDAIVMRALARNPEERFATARDFAAAITRVLLQKQELIDSHAVETVIAALIDRETVPLELNIELDEPISDSEDFDYAEGPADAAPASFIPSAASEHAEHLHEHSGREVRHVAVITLRVHHVGDLYDAMGAARVRRLLEQLRATLSEIAFKRGANWIWEERQADAETRPLAARATVGLMGNPARAAIDAAFLAVDLHEAIHGACDGLPVTLTASVGIVRGLASGRCDAAGHLLRHTLHKPADELSDLLGQRAAEGQTWVLGGLYRLVRRDFVWRDAPAIEIDDADRRSLPRKLRVHVLERPLTREEKLAQRSHTRDLVGRDTELQSLRNAYRQAASVPYGEGRVAARVIIGEMGIGKTALVEAFTSELPESARVTQVECPPACRELPFSLIGRWLQELTGISPDTELGEAKNAILLALGLGGRQLGGHTEEVVRTMTELSIGRVAEAFDEADVAHYRRTVTSGVRRLLGRTAAQRPLIVLIDSIHWADLPSLELITLLARRPTAAPILLVLVARPDDRINPYIQGLTRIELGGLSSENQVRLVQSHLGVSKGVAQACADLIGRAAGNTFFLLEMVDT